MLRAVGGVILGYLTMFVFIFVSFTVAYLAMGTEKAFKADSYEVSTLWLISTFGLGLVAAILGGLVCVIIARGSTAVLVLAGLVFVFGVLSALPVIMGSEEETPPPAVVT